MGGACACCALEPRNLFGWTSGPRRVRRRWDATLASCSGIPAKSIFTQSSVQHWQVSRLPHLAKLENSVYSILERRGPTARLSSA